MPKDESPLARAVTEYIDGLEAQVGKEKPTATLKNKLAKFLEPAQPRGIVGPSLDRRPNKRHPFIELACSRTQILRIAVLCLLKAEILRREVAIVLAAKGELTASEAKAAAQSLVEAEDYQRVAKTAIKSAEQATEALARFELEIRRTLDAADDAAFAIELQAALRG